LLINGGGHPMAAGLTVNADKIDALRAFLNQNVRAQAAAGLDAAPLWLDGLLSIDGISDDLVNTLSELEPFGSGNDEPRFAVLDAQVAKADIVGSSHVRCFLSGRGGGRLKAIAFRSADSQLGVALLNAQGRLMHLCGTIRRETWQGRTNVQLVVDDGMVAG
jgi:single-stranded-DNA-specific exonuclease